MSSKNRTPKEPGKENKNEFFETPDYVTRALLPFVNIPSTGCVLDPCAGKGALLDVFSSESSVDCCAIELVQDLADACREQYEFTECADALDPGTEWVRASLYAMNPPFSLAEKFVQRALAEARRPGTAGIVACLIRVPWLFADERRWLREDMPGRTIGMNPRPSFGLDKNGKPGSDSTEYGWAIWYPNESGLTETRLRVVHVDKPKHQSRKPKHQSRKAKLVVGVDVAAPLRDVTGVTVAERPPLSSIYVPPPEMFFDELELVDCVGGRIEDGKLNKEPRP